MAYVQLKDPKTGKNIYPIAALPKGTAEEFKELNEIVKVHFPYKGQNTGDCTIIEAYGKVVMIDTGKRIKNVMGDERTSVDVLVEYMVGNTITKIDYLIISHYHDDHIGSATGLLELLDDERIDTSNTVFYLPHGKMDWSKLYNGYTKPENNPDNDDDPITDWRYDDFVAMEGWKDKIKSGISSRALTYVEPSEGERLVISGNCSLKFMNLLEEDFEEYYIHYYDHTNTKEEMSQYNNFSMIVEMTHYDNVFLFTGDVEPLAQSKLHSRIKEPDVYKFEHHGLNYNVNENFFKKINPKCGIICDYYASSGNTSMRAAYNKISNVCPVYSTNISGSVIVRSHRFGISVDSENGAVGHNEKYLLLQGEYLVEGSDLNELLLPTAYQCINATVCATLKNVPSGLEAGFKLINDYAKEKTLKQFIYPTYYDKEEFYSRNIVRGDEPSQNRYGSWYKFAGTKVT